MILMLYFNTLLFSRFSESSQYYVRAGSNKIDRSGSVHRVTNIHVYNDTYRSWFLGLFHHDIVLLKVKPPFRFSRTVRPVRLPRSTHELPFELLVCGWGYINDKKVSKLNCNDLCSAFLNILYCLFVYFLLMYKL